MELSKDEYTLVPNEKMEGYRMAKESLEKNRVLWEEDTWHYRSPNTTSYALIPDGEFAIKVDRIIRGLRSQRDRAERNKEDLEYEIDVLIRRNDISKEKLKHLKIWKIAAWCGGIAAIVHFIHLLILWN